MLAECAERRKSKGSRRVQRERKRLALGSEDAGVSSRGVGGSRGECEAGLLLLDEIPGSALGESFRGSCENKGQPSRLSSKLQSSNHRKRLLPRPWGGQQRSHTKRDEKRISLGAESNEGAPLTLMGFQSASLRVPSGPGGLKTSRWATMLFESARSARESEPQRDKATNEEVKTTTLTEATVFALLRMESAPSIAGSRRSLRLSCGTKGE